MNEYMKKFQDELFAAEAEGKTILVSKYRRWGEYKTPKPMTAEKAFHKFCISVWADDGWGNYIMCSPYKVEIV